MKKDEESVLRFTHFHVSISKRWITMTCIIRCIFTSLFSLPVTFFQFLASAPSYGECMWPEKVILEPPSSQILWDEREPPCNAMEGARRKGWQKVKPKTNLHNVEDGGVFLGSSKF